MGSSSRGPWASQVAAVHGHLELPPRKLAPTALSGRAESRRPPCRTNRLRYSKSPPAQTQQRQATVRLSRGCPSDMATGLPLVRPRACLTHRRTDSPHQPRTAVAAGRRYYDLDKTGDVHSTDHRPSEQIR